MQRIKNDLISAARHEIGHPYQHHYRPENLCDGGLITVGECMERGLGEWGYDCSGLVITSLCKVLDVPVTSWPHQLRHSRQLSTLVTNDPPAYGDIVHIEYHKPGLEPQAHTALYVDPNLLVHTDGVSEMVVEGPFDTDIISLQAISLRALLSELQAVTATP